MMIVKINYDAKLFHDLKKKELISCEILGNDIKD